MGGGHIITGSTLGFLQQFAQFEEGLWVELKPALFQVRKERRKGCHYRTPGCSLIWSLCVKLNIEIFMTFELVGTVFGQQLVEFPPTSFFDSFLRQSTSFEEYKKKWSDDSKEWGHKKLWNLPSCQFRTKKSCVEIVCRRQRKTIFPHLRAQSKQKLYIEKLYASCERNAD